MLSLQEITAKIGKNHVSELARKDSLRRACVKEFTHRLNAERARDNDMKVERYMWTHQVSRTEALKVLLYVYLSLRRYLTFPAYVSGASTRGRDAPNDVIMKQK